MFVAEFVCVYACSLERRCIFIYHEKKKTFHWRWPRHYEQCTTRLCVCECLCDYANTQTIRDYMLSVNWMITRVICVNTHTHTRIRIQCVFVTPFFTGATAATPKRKGPIVSMDFEHRQTLWDLRGVGLHVCTRCCWPDATRFDWLYAIWPEMDFSTAQRRNNTWCCVWFVVCVCAWVCCPNVYSVTPNGNQNKHAPIQIQIRAPQVPWTMRASVRKTCFQRHNYREASDA